MNIYRCRTAVAVEADSGNVGVAIGGNFGVPDPMIAGFPQFAAVAREGRHLILALGGIIALVHGQFDGVRIGLRGASDEPGEQRDNECNGLKVFSVHRILSRLPATSAVYANRHPYAPVSQVVY